MLLNRHQMKNSVRIPILRIRLNAAHSSLVANPTHVFHAWQCDLTKTPGNVNILERFAQL